MLPLQSAAAAAVPAPVALGQLEHRHRPRVLAERRLDVVVAVEQHGRRALGPGRVAVHAVASRRASSTCGRPAGPAAANASTTHWAAFSHSSRRELLRVGDRLERDELGQVVLRLAHQRLDGLTQRQQRAWGSFLVLMRGRGCGLDRDRVRAGGRGGRALDGRRARRAVAPHQADQQDAGGRTRSPSSARSSPAPRRARPRPTRRPALWLFATALLTIAITATATAAPT